MALGSRGSRQTILAFVAGPLTGAAVIVAIHMAIFALADWSDPGNATMGEVVNGFLRLMGLAVPLAAVTALVLGLPAFLLLKSIGGLTAFWCTFTGGLLASVPLTAYLWLRNPFFAAAIVPGMLLSASVLFLGGGVGGWVCWYVQRLPASSSTAVAPTPD